MTNVLLEKKGNIAVATINRPKALNALNSQVLEDLNELVELVKACLLYTSPSPRDCS